MLESNLVSAYAARRVIDLLLTMTSLSLPNARPDLPSLEITGHSVYVSSGKLHHKC